MDVIQKVTVAKSGIECIHNASSARLLGDVPFDAHEQNRSFSYWPVGVMSLVAYAMSVIGIPVNSHGINMTEAKMGAAKIMSSKPPKKSLGLKSFYMPSRKYSAREEQMIEGVAKMWPAHLILDPDIEQLFAFEWLIDE